MRGDDFLEIKRYGDNTPVRRMPTVSDCWYAVGMFRQRHGLVGTQPLPPGVYMVDDGDGALVLVVDEEGKYTFGFDPGCPPTSEWAGTPDGKPSQDPSAGRPDPN